ncbi:hypothetical protein GJ496_011963 [Pomphorhynchus laevis]|nr:hypothetical protein GJ496_011963 [Pomphorhynchus laevis]
MINDKFPLPADEEDHIYGKVKRYLLMMNSNTVYFSAEDMLLVYKRLKTVINKIHCAYPISHRHCRNCAYGNLKNPIRYFVPDELVAWFVPYADYKPVVFSVNIVQTEGSVQQEPKRRQTIMDESLLRNPVGRTGVKGQGLLRSYGINKSTIIIRIRWVPDNIRGDPGRKLQISMKKKTEQTLYHSFQFYPEHNDLANVHLIFDGYFDTPFNTDNAWEEIKFGCVVVEYNNTVDADDSQQIWMDIDDIRQIYPDYQDQLIYHVVNKYKVPCGLISNRQNVAFQIYSNISTNPLVLYIITKSNSIRNNDKNSLDEFNTVHLMRGTDRWALPNENEITCIPAENFKNHPISHNLIVKWAHVAILDACNLSGLWSIVDRSIDLPIVLKDILADICEQYSAHW